MRELIRIIAFIMLSFMLAGCASFNFHKQATVPPERIYFTQPAMETNPAKVLFIRDRRRGASGGYHQHIYLNGKRIASIRPGEQIELRIPAGNVVLGVKPTDPFGLHKLFTIQEKFESGKDYSYRLFATADESRMERIELETSEEE